MRTAEAFANATYQSVYIIDYFRKNFLFVSPNPLFLCGMSAEEVKDLGYQFYLDHIPADEVNMLLEINHVRSRRFRVSRRVNVGKTAKYA